MTDVSSDQREYVKELVDYLNENVLDPDGQVTTLDLLDALASIGARLVDDDSGQSSTDYSARLSGAEFVPASDT